MIAITSLYERRVIRGSQNAHYKFNRLSAPVCIRFLELRREDRAGAFCVRQT